MDRKNFYYERQVTKDDLNGIQTYIEDATRAISADVGMWGAFSGLDLAQTVTPSTNITVSVGGAYSGSYGKRLAVSSQQTLDCSVDHLGNTTYTDMSSGYGRWLGIFLAYDEVESDPQVDGHGSTVNFEIAESFTLKVYKGSVDIVANKNVLAHPSLVTGEIKLGDIWMERDNPNIVATDIDYSERQDLFRTTIFGTEVSGGTFKEFIANLTTAVNGITIGDIVIDADILPDTDASYDIGSSSKRFEKLFLSDDATIDGNIDVGGNITAVDIDPTGNINLDAGHHITIATSVANTITKILGWASGNGGEGYSGTTLWTMSYSNITSATSSVYWFMDLNLPAGAKILTITADWEPVNANLGEMEMLLKEYTFGAAGETQIGSTVQSNAAARGTGLLDLSSSPHTVANNKILQCRFDFTTSGSKLYGVKVTYYKEYWPL